VGRRKAAENCVVLPWVSARIDCKEGRFLQIGNSLLLSEQFKALSAGAKHLYICMTMESGGRRAFVFPLAAAKKYGVASTSFRRYIEELEAKGFIEVHSNANLRQKNDYLFSLTWKQKPL
jgi:hypothetical protein